MKYHYFEDVWTVFWRDWIVLKRRMTKFILSRMVAPMLYLVAFGWGLGRSINTGGGYYAPAPVYAAPSLNVVIPWSVRRFQFTSKANTRTVSGTVTVGDRRFVLGAEGDEPTYAALDVGRGVWKYDNRWNWASGSGRGTGGELVGLQFGGKWTEGTGYNENGLCIDGRLHKIHNELEWSYDWDNPMAPWRVTDPVGDLVDATLTPTYDRYGKTSIGVLSMEVHQMFGTWSGRAVAESGETVSFDGIVGFAEEARNKW